MYADSPDAKQAGEAGVALKSSQAALWSLVLSAVAIPHQVEQRDNVWIMVVPPHLADQARQQLALLENANWPPKGDGLRENQSLAHSFPLVVLVMGSLIFLHGITGPWSHDNVWFARGAVSGHAVLQNGEWWRLVTGLTLHSDPVHLLGNVAIGGILMAFLCGRIGWALGFFLPLTAGGVGNAINLFFRGPQLLSVGYSTAVFGMVGILCGLDVRRGGTVKGALLPLGAGLALLAMLGTAGERTDLWAHLWGMAVGFLLGVMFNGFRESGWLTRIKGCRVLLLPVGIGIVLGCWWAAFSF